MQIGIRTMHTYNICEDCYSLNLYQIPSDLGEYYPENYYSFRKIGKHEVEKYRKNKWRIFQLKILLFNTTILRYVYPYSSSLNNLKFLKKIIFDVNDKILDVGAGTGESFLLPLYMAGMKNLYGIDPYIKESFLIDKTIKTSGINDRKEIEKIIKKLL